MDILDKIISAESSGNLKKANQPNKTSSALGLGQFINGTWLDMIKRYRPRLADVFTTGAPPVPYLSPR